MSEYFVQTKKVLGSILAINLLVSVSKISVALYIHSAALLGDGFHSLADGMSNIIGLIGLKIAEKPEDENHPYGHKKFENIASLGIAILLFVLGFNLFVSTAKNFFAYTQIIITPAVLVFMVITLVINVFVVCYEKKKGRELNSDILLADSEHTKSDILITLSVIIGLILTELGYFLVDKTIAMGVSILILKAGYEISKQGIKVLSDSTVVDPLKIKKSIYKKFKEVRKCYKIRTHGREDDIHVDLHIKVDADTHLNKAHRLTHQIDEHLKKEFPGIKHTFIHVEPYEKQ